MSKHSRFPPTLPPPVTVTRLFAFREALKVITKSSHPFLKKHNPYLFLHALNLSPNPLDRAVELRDLDLCVLEAVSMFACSNLQLFILVGRSERSTLGPPRVAPHNRSQHHPMQAKVSTYTSSPVCPDQYR